MRLNFKVEKQISGTPPRCTTAHGADRVDNQCDLACGCHRILPCSQSTISDSCDLAVLIATAENPLFGAVVRCDFHSYMADDNSYDLMPRRYADIYPSLPLINSEAMAHVSAASLMSLRYFQADPDTMPEEVFAEHHVLLNLNPTPHRVQNWRDGELRDFTYHLHEIIVTPAGMRSGWRWFAKSDVIVVTLDPQKVAAFAQRELGLILDRQQLVDLPQFTDPDLCQAGVMLRDALESDDLSSGVMFEAMSRVFLVKLLQKYGKQRAEELALSARFTSDHFHRVLAYIRANLDQTITVDDLAREVAMSPSHFGRVFKETLGETPMQYVLAYRIEQAVDMMAEKSTPLGEIALACGFADQAHFSRSFKQIIGQTPRAFRGA